MLMHAENARLLHQSSLKTPSIVCARYYSSLGTPPVHPRAMPQYHRSTDEEAVETLLKCRLLLCRTQEFLVLEVFLGLRFVHSRRLIETRL